MELFEQRIVNLIHQFTLTQKQNLYEIAKVIVDSLEKQGKFFTFGTGHSHMVGEEFYARAGGLACTQLIAPMELTLGSHPLKSTQIERIGEYAQVIMMEYKMKEGDIVLISSNSGRNSLPIEMALELRKRQIKTIAFTNLKHSQSVTSRHPSGKRLFEVCDYVIDNCGEMGDACIEIDGVKGKMGASSNIIGMYMAQLLSMFIAKEIVLRKMKVPIFLSANVDGGDEWNERLMKDYYGI